MSDIRKLKVYQQSSGDEYVPTIMLKGKWLETYCFSPGSFIAVECENGKLTITLREPDKEPTLEERVENLTKSQKKKLSEVLDEMGV